MNFLITVVLVVLAVAVLVPLFLNFIGFGSKIICDTLCTLDPGSGGWNPLSLKKWVKDGIHGVLGYFMGNLDCPACTTLPKLEDIHKGDTLVIKGNLEGDNKYLEKFKLADKDKKCGIKVADADKKSGGWWGGGKTLLLAIGAGVITGLSCLAFGACLAVGPITFGALGTGLAAGGITYVATEGLNQGTAEAYRRLTQQSLTQEKVEEVKTELEEAEKIDDLKHPFKLIVEAYTTDLEKAYKERFDCERFEDEENCTDEGCNWWEGGCHDIPKAGFERKVEEISDDSFETCVEEVSGKSYNTVDVDYFVAGEDASDEERKEASKHTAQVVLCTVVKETPLDQGEVEELKEFIQEMQAGKTVLNKLILDWEPGDCPLKFKSGGKLGCDIQNCPIEDKGRCKLWTTPWQFEIQLRDDCGKGEGRDCRVALPTTWERAMKMMPAEEVPEKKESYHWMPKGDLLCDFYGDKKWHLCNVGPHQSRSYTAKVGDMEVDFTCSNYNWTLSEKGTEEYVTPEGGEVTIFPTYSTKSTNSTTAGKPVKHSVRWKDDEGLSGYIFSFDNCTGTFVNDTWTAWTGNPTTAWSNVTKTVNSTVGCEAGWKVYANDTDGNWTVSDALSYYTASEGTPASIPPNEDFIYPPETSVVDRPVQFSDERQVEEGNLQDFQSKINNCPDSGCTLKASGDFDVTETTTVDRGNIVFDLTGAKFDLGQRKIPFLSFEGDVSDVKIMGGEYLNPESSVFRFGGEGLDLENLIIDDIYIHDTAPLKEHPSSGAKREGGVRFNLSKSSKVRKVLINGSKFRNVRYGVDLMILPSGPHSSIKKVKISNNGFYRIQKGILQRNFNWTDTSVKKIIVSDNRIEDVVCFPGDDVANGVMFGVGPGGSMTQEEQQKFTRHVSRVTISDNFIKNMSNIQPAAQDNPSIEDIEDHEAIYSKANKTAVLGNRIVNGGYFSIGAKGEFCQENVIIKGNKIEYTQDYASKWGEDALKERLIGINARSNNTKVINNIIVGEEDHTIGIALVGRENIRIRGNDFQNLKYGIATSKGGPGPIQIYENSFTNVENKLHNIESYDEVWIGS